MDIYGVGLNDGSYEYSDELYFSVYEDSDIQTFNIYEKNDLIVDGDPTEITRSRVILFVGLIQDPDEDLSPIWDTYQSMGYSDGPYLYGEKWTSTLYFVPSEKPYGNVRHFTIEETLYVNKILWPDTSYNMDRAFVHVTTLERPDDSVTTGQIQLTVMDGNLQAPATVRMYKNGIIVHESLYIPDGSYRFDDLEFGTYRFVVTDTDYETFFYDAFPQQAGYSYDIGTVELSKDLNVINYMIRGDFPKTPDSSFKPDSSFEPDEPDEPGIIEKLSDLLGGSDDDSSPDEPGFMDLLKQIVEGLGLLTIVLIGLPIFIIIFVIIMLAGYVAGGKKQ